MSYPQAPRRSSSPFGNPFRVIIPKPSSNLSPKLLALLNSFEHKLATRIQKLHPTDGKDVLTLSWMTTAIQSLCGIHTDMKDLIADLDLPITNWDNKWIDIYLNNSMKLLDICNAFTSEISRVKQGHLFLHCALHNLSTGPFTRARNSLDGWKQHIGSKSSRFDQCFSAMDSLVQSLDLPRIKNSSKGKVLMNAIYGVKVVTLFVCSIFAATFAGSTKMITKMEVPESYLWGKAFIDLQSFITNTHSNEQLVLKEIKAVDATVEKVYSLFEQDGFDAKALETNLRESVEKLGDGMNVLAKEVDGFFHVVLTSRDALVCGLTVGNKGLDRIRGINWEVRGGEVRNDADLSRILKPVVICSTCV